MLWANLLKARRASQAVIHGDFYGLSACSLSDIGIRCVQLERLVIHTCCFSQELPYSVGVEWLCTQRSAVDYAQDHSAPRYRVYNSRVLNDGNGLLYDVRDLTLKVFAGTFEHLVSLAGPRRMRVEASGEACCDVLLSFRYFEAFCDRAALLAAWSREHVRTQRAKMHP